jgi:hypothetical protein
MDMSAIASSLGKEPLYPLIWMIPRTYLYGDEGKMSLPVIEPL